MEHVFIGFDGDGQKVTVIKTCAHQFWSAWHHDYANPSTRLDVVRAFRSMLVIAQKTVDHFADGRPLDNDDELSPIMNLFAWTNTCRQFVKANRIRLLAARMQISTPADFSGTQTKPFCEQGVEACDYLIQNLSHFVNDPKLPVQDQIQAASDSGKKLRLQTIHVADLLRLIQMELEVFFPVQDRYRLKDITNSIGIDARTLNPHFDVLGIPHHPPGRGEWFIDRPTYFRLLRRLESNAKSPGHRHAAKLERIRLGDSA